MEILNYSFKRIKSLTNYLNVYCTAAFGYIWSVEICFCCDWGEEDRGSVCLPMLHVFFLSVDDSLLFKNLNFVISSRFVWLSGLRSAVYSH